MKQKNVLAVLLAAFLTLSCLTACGSRTKPVELTEPQTQEVVPETPAEEPAKPEVPQTPDEPEEPKEPKEPEVPEEPEMTFPEDNSLTALRERMEPSDAIAGIVYLGYWDQGPLTSDFFATLDPQACLKDFGFLSSLPDEQLVANDGYEVYCIIPADPNAAVTVTQWLELEENDYAPGPGATLYDAPTGQPFLLQANVSDILPNTAITITDSRGRTLEQYQPQISLRDGTVVLSAEDQPVVLDFTEYLLPPAEEGPAAVSFDLYLPNANADGFDTEYLEDHLLGPTYLLPVLVDRGVLPMDLVFNSFSEEGADLYLDLGVSFQDYLNTQGTTGELMTLGSLVNTFLSAYGAETLTITVDGNPLETGHNFYDEPLTWITIEG